jgi:Spy/CpxP family protein refolding chaperone
MTMHRRNLVLIALAWVACTPLTAFAQKEKKPSLPPGDLFFYMKGQPFALETIFPGINGTIMLTDDQKLKLQEARENTVGSDAVKDAGKLLKTDPNATEAQKESAKKTIQEAKSKLQAEVSSILTPEQKALIEKLQGAAVEAHTAARAKFETDFTGAKGDKAKMEELQTKMREEVRAEFDRKLVGILTAEQRAAMEKAAAAQKAAQEAGKTKKKGNP